MEDRTYVFIDGEYLRQRHREEMTRFFGVEGDLDISSIMRETDATRVYFYDAVDYGKKPAEDDAACANRILEKEQFLASIGRLSGFFVRPGSVRPGKKREQKEVDVLLAVDMMEHVLNRTVTKAVLIAGDVDFRPVIEALVRHGVTVHVWYHLRSFAQELPSAADFGHEITFRQLHSWNTGEFRRLHRVPDEDRRGGDAWGELLKEGYLERPFSARVELHQTRNAGQVQYFLWIFGNSWEKLVVFDPDLDLIERYVAVQYSPIRWEPKEDVVIISQDRGD
jgi:uncharacterized LabA/DUF88 family protein